MERLRLSLALVLAGAGTLVALASTTATAPSGVLLVALAATAAAVIGLSRPSVPPVRAAVPLTRRRVGDVPPFRAGRVTDSPRHPLRPRAPGLG